MTGRWRATARMMATTAAATVISRAAESVRRLLAETSGAERTGPRSRPEPLRFLESAVPLTADASLEHAVTADHVVAAQSGPWREFGPAPAPVAAPTRGIGFRSEPPRPAEPTAEMPVISRPSREPDESEPVPVAEPVILVEPETALEEPEVDAPEPIDIEQAFHGLRLSAPPVEDTPLAPATPPVGELVEPAREPEPADRVDTEVDMEQPPDAAETGKHRRHDSAISGTVRSTYGRGLRGMRVAVLDTADEIVATARSGTNGAYVVEGITAGRYRVTAGDDVDGDFGTSWHDRSSLTNTAALKVKDGGTRRKADITLTATAAIDVEVHQRKKKVVATVRVTDRGTGAPAEGSVRLSTKLFATELALTGGAAAITMRGSKDGLRRSMLKKLRVDYLGTRHTAPASRSVRLR